MSNYKETVAEATTWKRCKHIEIFNPLNTGKYARFNEEEIIQVNGRVLPSYSAGSCETVFDPTANIMLRDVETGELDGTYVTQAHLYQILYSLYMQTALNRDTIQELANG